MIDTRKETRRRLRFNSINELESEIDKIAAADAAGMLRTTGNWTAGQILAHIAAWIEYAYTGYPLKAPPFFVRWVLRLMRSQLLRNGFKPGVRIPGVKEGTTGMDQMETSAAIQRLRVALRRLASDEPAKFPSPAFGDMSHQDRIALNLRHAELHLGFLQIN